ncbi:MAG: sigma 54-interacting transcriptional regulator [Aminipila sp.]
MKTIYMVFNDKEKISVSSSLYKNLKAVFEDYIKIKTCFLDEIEEGDISDGDLFIVLYKERVYYMKKYISSLDKVIVLSRTIQKSVLQDILSIPENTDVLVVNDSHESTWQTANTLYEIGINHINLVPYNADWDYEKHYKNINVAITPNEVSMVPKQIKNIINIGDRYLDLNTFITIINKLNLNNEKITRNLIKYTELIVGTNRGITEKYITDHVKSEMLKKIIYDSEDAIILTNQNYSIVYANDRAIKQFNINVDMEKNSLFSLFNEMAEDLIAKDNYSNKLFRLNGSNYIVNKNAIKILDQTVGYSISLNDEQNIKNIGNQLNEQLIKTGLFAKYSFDNIICISDNMKKCIEIAKKAALTDYTVLINGESGTGKELFAQSIHNYSNRNKNAFVAINCAALPESLLESELFGYEKGAFTGALAKGKIGLFERANKGSIFLDEIGDMPFALQCRLLRVLQEKQIMRLGSDKVIDIDIRIIAATNRNLIEGVETGAFRQDLYYRLCNLNVSLPPLRERREDILYIFKEFLGDCYLELTEAQKASLENYSWPGNVRELENVARYYKTLGELPQDLMYNNCFRLKHISIETKILDIINKHTDESSGIGRTAIMQILKSEDVCLSDDKTRKYLNKLSNRGLIQIGKGRIGTRITESGIVFLKEKLTE